MAPPPPQDEGELGQLAKMDSEMTEAVREIRQKVDEAKSSLSSNRSRGRVLDALMQQKKHGKIAGIYGRLVQLHERVVIVSLLIADVWWATVGFFSVTGRGRSRERRDEWVVTCLIGEKYVLGCVVNMLECQLKMNQTTKSASLKQHCC